MRLRLIAAAVLTIAPALAQAQTASAPLVVTATVVSSCKVDVPRTADASALPIVPIAVTCARRAATARVQRPVAPRRTEQRDAVVLINF